MAAGHSAMADLKADRRVEEKPEEGGKKEEAKKDDDEDGGYDGPLSDSEESEVVSEPYEPEPLWESKDQRAEILENARVDNKPDVRIPALQTIRDLATSQKRYRLMLWEDVPIRNVLLANAEGPDPDSASPGGMFKEEKPPPDDIARTVAIGALVQMASTPPVLREMVGNAQIRGVLMQATLKENPATEEPAPMPLQLRGHLAQANMARFGAIGGGKKTKKFTAAVLRGLDAELSPDIRAHVLGALTSVAARGANAVALWKDQPVREALFLCAKPKETEVIKLASLKFMWALAAADKNREIMWQSEEVWPALSACATEVQTQEVRTAALQVLYSLSLSMDNREVMWSFEPLRQLLMRTGAEVNDETAEGNPAEVRTASTSVLIQLSLCMKNHIPMSDAGVPALLESAENDERLAKKHRRLCTFAKDRIVEGAAPWPDDGGFAEFDEEDAESESALSEEEFVEPTDRDT